MKTIQTRKAKRIYSGLVARERAMFICFYVENEKQAEKWWRSFAVERRDRALTLSRVEAIGMEKPDSTAVWNSVVEKQNRLVFLLGGPNLDGGRENKKVESY